MLTPISAARPPESCASASPAGDKFRRRDSRPTARPPKRKNGTSAPKPAAISISRSSGTFFFVSRSMPISAAAASLDPPPSPRATGMRFFEARANAAAKPDLLADSLDGAIHKIFRPGRQGGIVRFERDSRDATRAIAQRIVQRNGLKNRAQLVIAVRAAAQNVQTQIDFRKRRQATDWNFFMHAGRLLRFGRFRGGFLRQAPLQDFQLRIDLVDFVSLVIGRQRFLPFGKRALEEVRRAVILSQLQIHIAEMAENRGIVAFAVHSFVQIFFGFGEFVLLVVSPAQAVEIGAVVRVPA